jgi:hypothetical protein
MAAGEEQADEKEKRQPEGLEMGQDGRQEKRQAESQEKKQTGTARDEMTGRRGGRQKARK